eukprot:TRINITY_DN95600_c0_g1_i1.p1 TRINITY_DN95600_c0_g1~~TRINITY_DN95600_c0_g1_i1.p1  ORF type:complete len:340 (+),score=29.48 TRINITY_DN95600_c0_g1_i1:53-1072(+)
MKCFCICLIFAALRSSSSFKIRADGLRRGTLDVRAYNQSHPAYHAIEAAMDVQADNQLHPAYHATKAASMTNTDSQCLYSFPPGSRVVVTMADNGYIEFVQRWASRMKMLGWGHQVLIALEDTVVQIAQAHVSCVLNYKGIMSFLESGLPLHVGLAKFDIMGILAEQNIEMALFSEMDVFWIQDPAPMLMAGPPLVALEDHPGQGDVNIGVLRVKPDAEIVHFLKGIAHTWNEIESRDSLAGTIVARDQNFFNAQLHERLGNRGPMWNVLDSTIFGVTNPPPAPGHGYDHLRVGQTICVHFIWHGFHEKKTLLDKMYSNVSLQDIIDYDNRVPWGKFAI